MGVVRSLSVREVLVVVLLMGVLGIIGTVVLGVPDVAASDHDWGSGLTYRECTNRGLTDYGRKTGQRWIGDFYANLYHCTAPTTTSSATATTTRAADWGSGLTYRECTSRGLTDYGRKTGQRWIGDFYANLYHCTAPTTTSSATATTTRAADWGSGLTYRECTSRGLTDYGRKTGQRWIGDFYANLYRCAAPPTTGTAGAVRNDVLRPDRYSSPDIGVTELSLHARPAAPFSFRPRPDLPVWDSSLPMDWAADPFSDRNWQFQLHAWVTMDYWLYAYQDGDVRALEEVAAIALDWERFHIEERRKSALQWYDMAVGVRASRLAFLLDNVLVGNLRVDDEDLAALMFLAELHVRMLSQPSFLSYGNHGLFQIAGLNALCLVISWRSVCHGARSYVEAAFSRLLDEWFTVESVHRENSPNYHGIVVDALRRLRVAERIEGSDVRTLIEKADTVTPWLTYPDGRWVPVGDSAGRGPRLTGPVESHCLQGEAGCWAVRDFTDSGYAIVRSLPGVEESSMLFVNAMFVEVKGEVIRHKHADDLGFVLIEGGREIFVDSGKYGYNKDEMRSYVLSARAHNIPSLVTRPIDPRRVAPARTRLQPIRMTESGFVVEGFVDRPKLLRHERMFSYVPGSSLTITDRLYNRTRYRWQSNLHLAPDLHPVITGSGFVVQVGDFSVEANFEGEGCDIDMTRGATRPYQGWVSIGYLEMTPATVVRATCPAGVVETSWDIAIRR